MEIITYPEEQQGNWRQRRLKKHQQDIQNPTKIYLASPYTYENELIRDRRFVIVSFLAAYFTETGYCVYSPIINGHTMVQYIDLPYEYDFWAARDKQFIRWCEEFWMVKLDGWEDSVGMPRELTEARLLHKRLKSVTLSTGMSERAFALECAFLKINGRFSEKVDLKITTREMK